MMTLDQIKAAVDRGETVHWANMAYTVIKDCLGRYMIAFWHGTPAANYIGLTHADGVTMNGCPSEFYIRH